MMRVGSCVVVLALAPLSSQSPYFADVRKSSLPPIHAFHTRWFAGDLDGDGRFDLVRVPALTNVVVDEIGR